MNHNSGSTPVFSIDTDLPGVRFFSNRETGRWALGKSVSPELDAYLSLPFPAVSPTRLPMIALNMGRQCNLDCSYCLTGTLREQRKFLTQDVGIKAIERVLELEEGDRHIVFHGSEPMLNFPLIQRLVLYAETINSGITFSIQTNGTLLSNQHLEFFVRHEIGIGVSLDGLRVHQDTTRPYLDGSSTYDDVRSAVLKVRDWQGYVSVIAVVTSSNVLDLQDIVADYEDMGVRAVFLHPVCCSPSSTQFPNDQDLIHQMKRVCGRYIQKKMAGENTINIQNLSKILRLFFSSRSGNNCLPCGGGSHQPLLAIDIDGSIYPCDFFWEHDNYHIGNIYDTPLKDALVSTSNLRNTRRPADIKACGACNWRRYCGGGCLGEVFSSMKIVDKASPYCTYYKSLFKYVAKKLPLIHQNNLIHEFLAS